MRPDEDANDVKIRPYEEADVPQISRLYFNTIRRVNARDYSPQQIRAWAPMIHSSAYWMERFRKRRAYVAEYQDEIVGFVEYAPPGHIDCFYVHHAHQDQGIGTALMEYVESEARHAGTNRLYAEVSLTAHPFFERRGFSVIEEKETEYGGVSFRLYLMEKYLSVQRGPAP